jgi:hypothetical protein
LSGIHFPEHYIDTDFDGLMHAWGCMDVWPPERMTGARPDGEAALSAALF